MKLYNASSRKVEEGKHKNTDRVSHDIALVELIDYIQEAKMSAKDVVPISSWKFFFNDRLIELGRDSDVTGLIHSTYLKKSNTRKCARSQFLHTSSRCHAELRR